MTPDTELVNNPEPCGTPTKTSLRRLSIPAGRPLMLTLIIVTLATLAVLAPLSDWLHMGLFWTGTHGNLAALAFVFACALATVFVVPGSILTLAAGFLFGLPFGILLASTGLTLGAAAAFLIARFIARDWISAKIAHSPRFKTLDTATRHDGLVIAFLVRLSPLFPFTLVNYGLGITNLKFRDYVIATWLGTLPIISLYTYVGTLADSMDSLGSGLHGTSLGDAVVAVGLALTLALTWLIARKANRALKLHMDQSTDA